MIFDVLAILIVIEFVKALAEDGYSTVTGKPNPRLDRRRARQRSRRDNRIWGALVDYLGDVAEDARHQAAQKRQTQREQAQTPEPVPAAAGHRDPVLAPPAPRPRPRPGPGPGPGPVVIEADPVEAPRRGFWDLGPTNCTVCGEPGEIIDRPNGRTFTHTRTADRCPAINPRTTASTEPVDIALDDPQIPQPSDPAAAPEPTPVAAEASTEGTDARIIPLFPIKEDPMTTTTTTGEATGLVSAMNHAEALKKTYENYAAMGDTFVASLANGEVSGEAVAAAARAREAEQLAAAEWGACHTALAQQLNVKEAYNATPDAGSKQFVTSE